MLSSEENAGTLLVSAARTADTYAEMHNDAGFKGIILYFDATAIVDAPSVTPKIEFLNPATGEWESYLSGGACVLDSVAEDAWIIHPTYGIGGKTLLCKESPAPLPIIWRLFMDASNADSLTYSVGYQYLP